MDTLQIFCPLWKVVLYHKKNILPCIYIRVGWCIGKCPLYRGVLYSECPLSEVPLYLDDFILS